MYWYLYLNTLLNYLKLLKYIKFRELLCIRLICNFVAECMLPLSIAEASLFRVKLKTIYEYVTDT